VAGLSYVLPVDLQQKVPLPVVEFNFTFRQLVPLGWRSLIYSKKNTGNGLQHVLMHIRREKNAFSRSSKRKRPDLDPLSVPDLTRPGHPEDFLLSA
jgi:hypothetical protein